MIMISALLGFYGTFLKVKDCFSKKKLLVTGLLNGLAMMELNVTQQKYSFPKPLNHLTANLAYT
jgi:hypothetical protein